MQCPLCLDHTLEPRFSHGIEVDVCPNCKGVWLDRGELERLVSQAPPSTLLAASSHPSPQDGQPLQRSVAPSESHERRRESSDHDRDTRSAESKSKDKNKKKKSKDKSKKKRKPKSWGDLLEDVLDDVLDL